MVSVPPKKLLTPATGGVNPPFGSSTVFAATVVFVSEAVPPEFETPPTAALNALGPPGALALFPLTVLFVNVTTLPGAEFRIPPNASLGDDALFPLTVLFDSVTVPPQQKFTIPPTVVSKASVAVAVFPRTVLLTSVTLPPWLPMPPAPLRKCGTEAVFPSTTVFVNVSVPPFWIPPANVVLVSVCPPVIVRLLRLTVVPRSTTRTVPAPCPFNVAPPLPLRVRLREMSYVPLHVP
jgi:hypothetical protein